MTFRERDLRIFIKKNICAKLKVKSTIKFVYEIEMLIDFDIKKSARLDIFTH